MAADLGGGSPLPPSSAGLLARSLSTLDTATTSEPARGGASAFDLDAWAPGAPGEAEEGGYSSYSDTDLEDAGEVVEGPTAAAAAADDDGALAPFAAFSWQPRGGSGAVLAEELPWSMADIVAEQAQQQQQQEQEQEGGATLAPLVPSGPQRRWKQSRRSVEWRVRWLELRMRELHRQRQRYAAKRRQLQEQQGANDALPSAATAAAAAATVQPVVVKQEEEQQPGGQQQRHHQPRPRQPQPQLQLPGLLAHPFFAAAAGRSAPPLQLQQQPGQQSRQGGKAAAAAEAPSLQLDDPNYPARVHVALDLLERRLGALRHEVLALQRPDLAGGSALLGSGPAAAGRSLLLLPQQRGGGRGRGRAPATPRSRSGMWGAVPAKPSSSQHHHREDALGKRRRSEFDLGEVITTPKFVERTQVKTIDTPKVRLLPAEELKQREEALAAYSANLREGVKEPKAAKPLLAVCPEEEQGTSSEEDISDEAFAARHRALEEEERLRYQSYAGKPTGRNKKPNKMPEERGRLKPLRSLSASVHHTPVALASLGLPSTPSGVLLNGGTSAGAALGGREPPASAPAALGLAPASTGPSLSAQGASAAAAAGLLAAPQGSPALPAITTPQALQQAAAGLGGGGAAAGPAAGAAQPAAAAAGVASGQGSPQAGSPAAAAGGAPPTAASAVAPTPLAPAAQQQGAAPGPAPAASAAEVARAAAPASDPATGGGSRPVAAQHAGDLPPALRAIIPNGTPRPLSGMQATSPAQGHWKAQGQTTPAAEGGPCTDLPPALYH
ncbi:hypothetical protein N2152v2_006787 [Parachlorella kessleri]